MNNFLNLFPSRHRRLAAQVFQAAKFHRLTPAGLLRHVRELAVWKLALPGLYADLGFWKRLRDLIDTRPAEAQELAAVVLAERQEVAR